MRYIVAWWATGRFYGGVCPNQSAGLLFEAVVSFEGLGWGYIRSVEGGHGGAALASRLRAH
jgi:hypothetical protein